jgi:hypothetical protein
MVPWQTSQFWVPWAEAAKRLRSINHEVGGGSAFPAYKRLPCRKKRFPRKMKIGKRRKPLFSEKQIFRKGEQLFEGRFFKVFFTPQASILKKING